MKFADFLDEQKITTESVVDASKARLVTEGCPGASESAKSNRDFISGEKPNIDFPGGDDVVITLYADVGGFPSGSTIRNLTINDLPVTFRRVETQETPTSDGGRKLLVHISGSLPELREQKERFRCGRLLVKGQIENGPQFAAFSAPSLEKPAAG